MYTTYNIHTQTHNLEFLQVFSSRQEAIDHLKKDSENHILKFSGLCRWVTKKSEINSLPDGYYLRFSQKHANRVVAYEKRTNTIRGYIYNSVRKDIVKLYIYSITEVPCETITKNNHRHCRPSLGAITAVMLRNNDSASDTSSNVSDETTHCDSPDAYMAELKACLKSRRIALGHGKPYLLE